MRRALSILIWIAPIALTAAVGAYFARPAPAPAGPPLIIEAPILERLGIILYGDIPFWDDCRGPWAVLRCIPAPVATFTARWDALAPARIAAAPEEAKHERDAHRPRPVSRKGRRGLRQADRPAARPVRGRSDW